jgi:hypothetical protein
MKSNPCRELSAPAADPTGRTSVFEEERNHLGDGSVFFAYTSIWLSFVFLILIYGECD